MTNGLWPEEVKTRANAPHSKRKTPPGAKGLSEFPIQKYNTSPTVEEKCLFVAYFVLNGKNSTRKGSLLTWKSARRSVKRSLHFLKSCSVIRFSVYRVKEVE
ncbi:hypothetical protein AVEN_70200-1 [Araneus ventricosus]|uniref:Uncharacterized protein n=1 Tax=Araneus ventricosus TaxID=182803 RepID=A0A4Y2FHF0_ARAVE|nr:hypothetical protein AVEN_70200-1 [Araneus ventricosus]